MVNSVSKLFLLLQIITAEAENYKSMFQNLQLKIKNILGYREKDVHLIESLIAERTEDRRKLEALTRDVENYRNEISMTLKIVEQNEQTINLRQELSVVLKEREKDQEIIQELQAALYAGKTSYDIKAHVKEEHVDTLDKDKHTSQGRFNSFASGDETTEKRTDIKEIPDTDKRHNLTVRYFPLLSQFPFHTGYNQLLKKILPSNH